MSTQQPVPAVRRWRFNQVNNRTNTPSPNPQIRVATLSSDSRRVHEQYVGVAPLRVLQSPVASSSSLSDQASCTFDPRYQNEFGESSWNSSWDPEPPSLLDEEPEGEDLELSDDNEYDEEDEVDEDGITVKVPRKKYNSDTPFNQFKLEAPLMLKEFIRGEGRGGVSEECGGECGGDEPALYRCTVCKNPRLYRRECMVERHRDRPLDRIEFWNGCSFETTTLAKIGLTIQTGHMLGERCGFPRAAKKGFVVVDLDFMQTVELSYCGCQHPSVVGRPWQQLFRTKLFPATLVTPHTAFTFRALKLLHGLMTTGKMTTYHFYRSIEAATDLAGVMDTPRGRYNELTRVLRMWRYLRTLKRGGVGSSLEPDLSAIPAGSLAVVCPACPNPKVNLPENWLDIVKEKQLKRRRVSSEEQDPGISTGKTYFVEQQAYQEQMLKMKDVPEEKIDPHCTGHGLAAIEQAYTKFRKGYATTGCILCLCARHEIVEPNGLGRGREVLAHGLLHQRVSAAFRPTACVSSVL
ncbi:hypothetical protein V5O48_016052 [Marasmius crinis-equi]|uniref:CxC2-like cysteine cluster KDZ transposase-associated domain-containing protein n=1 Tax=Marasmius crinis-equi TaxID=585013 RepID=A0ABR3EST5_9AGAR